MRNTELENLGFVKALLMLIIVLTHSCCFWNNDWFIICRPVFGVLKLSQILINWLGSWHTYAFTLVSGYLFYYLRFERKAYEDVKLFFKKKIQRLLIPAYFVGLTWVIPVSIYFWGDWSKEFWKFISGVGPSQLWFLFMLFDVFVVAYIVWGGVDN